MNRLEVLNSEVETRGAKMLELEEKLAELERKRALEGAEAVSVLQIYFSIRVYNRYILRRCYIPWMAPLVV
jgi:hypothetical protein